MSGGLMESVQHFIAGLLDLGRTRFELFSVEMREELARLAVTLIGGMAVLILALFGIAFGATAVIVSVSEANRLTATICVAVLFFALAGGVALWLRRDLTAIKQ